MKILICIIQIIFSKNVFCQNIETIIKSKPITISGNVNFNTNADFLEDSLNSYYYLSGGLNTTIFGIVSIPISFAYSDNTLTKNLSLPFNRFSLSPNYKEYTLYLGYNSMNFSKYTMSGHDYFGGGASYQGSTFQVEAFYGRLRKAVVPDSTTNDAGYKRIGGGLKFGYKNDNYNLSANFIKIKDIDNSVDFSDYPEQFVNPKDNFAASISGQIMLLKQLSLTTEFGYSEINTKQFNNEISSTKITYKAIDVAISLTGSTHLQKI